MRELTRCAAVPEAQARGRNWPPLPLVASTDLAEYYGRGKPRCVTGYSQNRATERALMIPGVVVRVR